MRLDKGELWKRVFNKLGLEDVDKIIVQISPEEMGGMQQEQMMAEEQALQPEMGIEPALEPEMPQEGLEEATAPIPEEDPEVTELQMELAQTMEQYGLDQEQSALIMQARRQGASEEAVAAYLQQGGVAHG
jgi:hypothetical protein